MPDPSDPPEPSTDPDPSLWANPNVLVRSRVPGEERYARIVQIHEVAHLGATPITRIELVVMDEDGMPETVEYPWEVFLAMWGPTEPDPYPAHVPGDVPVYVGDVLQDHTGCRMRVVHINREARLFTVESVVPPVYPVLSESRVLALDPSVFDFFEVLPPETLRSGAPSEPTTSDAPTRFERV
jgi:hypothetical protein